jgi:hypothetical protein
MIPSISPTAKFFSLPAKFQGNNVMRCHVLEKLNARRHDLAIETTASNKTQLMKRQFTYTWAHTRDLFN